MSIALSQVPTKAHEIGDDLESLFWVLVFSAIHFVAHRGRRILRRHRLFDTGPNATSNPSMLPHDTSAGKHIALTQEIFKDFPFLSSAFRALVEEFSLLWKDYYYTKGLVGRGYAMGTIHADIRDKVSSTAWLINFLDKAKKVEEGWVHNDIVLDQCPSESEKQEEKSLGKLIADTFDASHLTDSILLKAATRMAPTSDSSTQPRPDEDSDSLASDSVNIPARRLLDSDLSDDPQDKDEYTAGPARKKSRREERRHQTSRRSATARSRPVPKPPRVQPPRSTKHHPS